MANSWTSSMKGVSAGRSQLGFAEAAEREFAFLGSLGYTVIETSPTLVRYQSGDLIVNVFHGRGSYEIGFEIGYRGTLYSISELIRLIDPETAEKYRNFASTTPEGVIEGVARLKGLVNQYGERVLFGDPESFASLESQRRAWAESYALDVLARQVRPKADAAFRRGDYAEAAKLYERIHPRLSAVELKKLTLAKRRSS